MLSGMGDEQSSVYRVARQVVVNVTARLAGYLGPGPGAIRLLILNAFSRRHNTGVQRAHGHAVHSWTSCLPVNTTNRHMSC